MPVTKGAIRKQRADKRKHEVNLRIKDSFKRAVAVMRKKPTAKGLVAVYSGLDRAVKSKVIHANKAARLKSRLSNLLKRKTQK